MLETSHIIHTYSRREALADGVLVDLTEWAQADREFIGGFTVPVAVTASVWAEINNIPAEHRETESVRARAHEVLWAAYLAARKAPRGKSSLLFRVAIGIPD